MCKKIRIVNKSTRELPEEAIDAISFKSLTEANEVLEEYNLKISEMEREFEDGKLSSQTIVLIDTH